MASAATNDRIVHRRAPAPTQTSRIFGNPDIETEKRRSRKMAGDEGRQVGLPIGVLRCIHAETGHPLRAEQFAYALVTWSVGGIAIRKRHTGEMEIRLTPDLERELAGIASADAGRLIPDEDVLVWLQAQGTRRSS